MGGFTEGITGERSHRLVGSLMFFFTYLQAHCLMFLAAWRVH